MSEEVTVPAGMTAPVYPEWATTADPDIPRHLTTVAARLYELFGSGAPAVGGLPAFPFSTATGQGSGIAAYDTLKRDFQRIEAEFDAAAQAFKNAVQDSAYRTQAGRDAINNAIAAFNSTASTLEEGDWDGLLQAESTMLSTITTEVKNAAYDYAQGVPLPGIDYAQGVLLPGIDTAPSAGTSPAVTPGLKSGTGSLPELLSALAGAGLPMGGSPLGALSGLNPLAWQANPLGAVNPLASADAVKPSTDPEAGEKPPITPLKPDTEHLPPPATRAATTTPAGIQQPAPPENPAATPAANATTTVTLPDGKVIEGKNPGARVDPADVQAGDVLKWQDKTMVAVAPGLVADPNEPGVTHTLEEALKDQKGFQGILRPTAAAPIAVPAASSPRSEVPPAPSATVPQPAPPSPFENVS